LGRRSRKLRRPRRCGFGKSGRHTSRHLRARSRHRDHCRVHRQRSRPPRGQDAGAALTKVAYPGGAAAHSAAAAERLFPGDRELVSLETFADVVDAAAAGTVAYGVLPIENSLAGPVAETHDLLYDAPLSIVAETSLAIRHHLVARGPLAESEIRVIRSHPVALEQCRRLLGRLNGVRAIAA